MSATKRMERIEAETTEPLYEGGYREATIEKFAFMCCGCRLVWSRLSQAQDCESRGHKPAYQDRYVTGPIVNGVPRFERFYDRAALRREPEEVAPVANFDSPDELEYADQRHADELAAADAADRLLEEYEQACDRADALLEEYEGGLRLANLARVSKGIYRVSLTGREAKHGVDYLNVTLTPDERYGSVKIGEYNGESVGVIKRDGSLRLWPDVDPKSPRVVALLVAVEVILGSQDPIAFAKAYAVASATCWRCGADLVDERSRQVLMGPHCYQAEYGLTQRQGIKAGIGLTETDDADRRVAV